jgi:hypothetical protein
MKKTRKTKFHVSLAEIKQTLINKIVEQYGSINKFSLHEDAKSLGVEKSVKTILSKGGRNSLIVINKLQVYYGLPAIYKEEEIIRNITYFREPKK